MTALIGVLAWASVWLVQTAADRYGPWPAEAAPDIPHRPSRLRPRPSTRMAVQMAAGVAASFALGRLLHDDHWPWLVLTAHVVASGNRGRTDVLLKGVERFLGACAGTLLATGVAAAGITGHTAMVVLFAVLALALWLCPLAYACWVAGMTTALSLLLGCFGQDAQSLLPTRLAAIAVGAVLSVGASWFLLPVQRKPWRRRTA